MAKRTQLRRPQQTARTRQVSRDVSITEEHHRSLRDALMQLIAPSVTVRNQLIHRYDKITRDMAAYLALKGEAEELAKRQADAETTAVPDQRFALADGHIQNVSSEVMNILFPARNMYGSTAIDPENTNVVSSFLAVINLHAQQFGHYPQYDNMVYDALVYNLGVLESDWRMDTGFVTTADGPQQAVIRQGCEVLRLDPYNVLLDHSVPVERYGPDAEFYGKVERVSAFAVRKHLLDKKWFGPAGIEKALQEVRYEQGKVMNTQQYNATAPFYNEYTNYFGSEVGKHGLFRERPSTRPPEWYASDCAPKNHCRTFDVSSYMSDGRGGGDVSLTNLHQNELTTITARIVPQDYGLSDAPERQLEIWRFKVLNGHWIVSASPLLTTHGMLPIGVTAPASANGTLESKSLSEKLIPYQDLMSNIYNLYVKEMRKKVNNGLVFYDPKRVKLNEMRDPTSGFIPVSIPEDTDTATDRTVGSAVHKFSDAPPFNNTVNDVNQVNDMMQAVLPTDQLASMSGLDRAVNHQSKTVASAAARRTFREARIISDQAIAPIMFTLTMNVTAFQPAIKLIDDSGNTVEVNPETFKDADLKISVSDGLRGIDNIAIADRVSEMVRYALQSRRTQENIDVLKLMEYLMKLEGASFDIKSFRYDSPIDQLDEQGKQVAFQLYQQALQAQQQGQQGDDQ